MPRYGTAVAATLLYLAIAAPVTAGQLLNTYAESVQDVRSRYESRGIRAGSFWVSPTLEAGVLYDSNIQALPSNERDSWAGYVNGTVKARSDWGRHALGIYGDVKHVQHVTDSDGSHTDAHAIVEGQVDIMRDLVLFGSLSGGLFHETGADATSGTFSRSQRPVEHAEFEAAASLNKTFNRLTASVGGKFRFFDYSNDIGRSPAATAGLNFRDGREFSVGGRIGYLMPTGYWRLYTDARYSETDYDQKPAGHSSSRGVTVLAGVEISIPDRVRGHVSLGFEGRDHYGANRKSGTFAFDADVMWSVTPLMTVRLEATRKFAETTFPNIPAGTPIISGSYGRILTNARFSVDYEALRTLIVSPFLGFAHSDYLSSRTSSFALSAGLKAEKKIGRHWAVGGHYSYTVLDYQSAAANLDYDRHQIGIYVKARF